MEDIKDKLVKFREEREARQKARLEKLREMNLKKYAKDDTLQTPKQSNIPVANRQSYKPATDIEKSNLVSNNKRPSTVPMPKKQFDRPIAAKPTTSIPAAVKINKPQNTDQPLPKPKNINNVSSTKIPVKSPQTIEAITKPDSVKNLNNSRKSEAPRPFSRPSLYPNKSKDVNPSPKKDQKFVQPRKTMFVHNSKKGTNTFDKRQSVFERLYKPNVKTNSNVKILNNTTMSKNNGKIYNDVKKNGKNSNHIIISNMRRSISAVHFKKIHRNELQNCIHKWSSVGEKLEKLHVKEKNEDAAVKQEKIVSAVKSDRKKSVKFSKSIAFNLNTPKSEEMQEKLKTWLLKKGKNLDSYHHLQCFGIHHLESEKDSLKPFDDDNKENIEQPDGDDESFTENLNDRKDDFNSNKWRRASYISDSVDMNGTRESFTSEDVMTPKVHKVDDLLTGALNDLTELLREGFEWEQCARWLRAIRERFPGVEHKAVYWECRAALEERQGDLAATVECWEEAIAKGTERSVVEASLDQLMDKFMQLEISPNGGAKKRINPKLVDVKNVFVSRVIKLAVQQAKLKQTVNTKYTMTPVRRSSRLSTYDNLATPKDRMTIEGRLRTPGSSKRLPLIQLCTSMKQLDEEIRKNLVFVPNKNLDFTP
ncbi:hypothetical protein EVAR_97149_1 [Eumeta japonica]|uniref:Cytoskeleton-associated protein 2 n=1 Tax=Eumeta variegata TaxID=151549 RepID=A0A4C1XRS5_EUMVA|nr:hypothetical protein EVAR_97149_1 [Eumeta japonica]